MLLEIITLIAIFGLVRILWRIRVAANQSPIDQSLAERVPDKINLMIVYGSGGHTTEMSWIFKDYDFKTRCNRVFFLKAQSDHVTMAKVKQFIEEHKVCISQAQIQWIDIPRSREVKQSYVSSIFTTIKSISFTFVKFLPLWNIDALVINGPGTCVPVVLVILIQWLLLLRRHCRLIFLESWCRVNHLSLTAKLLYIVLDRIIVHWPELASKHRKCQYLGSII